MPNFSLLQAGRGKAKYVALRGRFRAGVLTGDWCFQRSFVAVQTPVCAKLTLDIGLLNALDRLIQAAS
jgi:hypothetical protein